MELKTICKTAVLFSGLALATAGFAQQSQQQQQRPQPGYGPGMMQGGPGYGGMGPGMMGGYGPGYGGMGPGMMGGYGPGYGGMGPGMMYGPGPFHALNLNDKQQQAISKIMEQHRHKEWGLMGKMNDQYVKLQQLYGANKWDKDAIGKTYDEIAKLRRQMIEDRVEARNQIYGQLTEQQRKQFQQWGGWQAD